MLDVSSANLNKLYLRGLPVAYIKTFKWLSLISNYMSAMGKSFDDFDREIGSEPDEVLERENSYEGVEDQGICDGPHDSRFEGWYENGEIKAIAESTMETSRDVGNKVDEVSETLNGITDRMADVQGDIGEGYEPVVSEGLDDAFEDIEEYASQKDVVDKGYSEECFIWLSEEDLHAREDVSQDKLEDFVYS